MSSSTTKKAASTTKASAKASPKPKAPVAKAPTPISTAKPADKPANSGPVMKKQELIEKVVRLSGGKKKDVKPVVEAMLAVLGDTLADGREFNLQPLGKLKLNRTKETPDARIIVAKIRQSKDNSVKKDSVAPVAAAAE